MLRQIVVIIGTLTNGSVLSYLALTALPPQIAVIAGILVFGTVLLLLGFYVANNDPKRRLRNNFELSQQMNRHRYPRSGSQARAA